MNADTNLSKLIIGDFTNANTNFSKPLVGHLANAHTNVSKPLIGNDLYCANEDPAGSIAPSRDAVPRYPVARVASTHSDARIRWMKDFLRGGG